ncbi:hypothetical protein EDEG_03396 [Edhazardia aedis USNM 41457]|uniref:Uncharacterized protein n=1 Tax=Edhazardia aedis (strain USNM 41457) TaxID=1003232 RepID=J9DLB9_EDHAE|nr:hypothetical protein EDEG_03396 [Edhazardia aedis USNM 41457]|eukprot:EJW02152.1 hypothetical protein EDEG_03396 [Edhazardia aedis USNM 41457]
MRNFLRTPKRDTSGIKMRGNEGIDNFNNINDLDETNCTSSEQKLFLSKSVSISGNSTAKQINNNALPIKLNGELNSKIIDVAGHSSLDSNSNVFSSKNSNPSEVNSNLNFPFNLRNTEKKSVRKHLVESRNELFENIELLGETTSLRENCGSRARKKIIKSEKNIETQTTNILEEINTKNDNLFINANNKFGAHSAVQNQKTQLSEDSYSSEKTENEKIASASMKNLENYKKNYQSSQIISRTLKKSFEKNVFLNKMNTERIEKNSDSSEIVFKVFEKDSNKENIHLASYKNSNSSENIENNEKSESNSNKISKHFDPKNIEISEEKNSCYTENNTKNILNTKSPSPIDSTANKGKDKHERSKAIHSTTAPHKLPETIANQVAHTTFLNYCSDFLVDINTKSLKSITKKKEPNIDKFLNANNSYFKEITYKELLLSAFIDQNEPFELEETEKDLKLNSFLKTVNEKEDQNKEQFLKNFFEANNIVNDKHNDKQEMIADKYKKQLEINNRRKEKLFYIIKQRMVYKAYFTTLRTIENEIVCLYSKRVKTRKKTKNDEFLGQVNELIKKRQQLIDSFSNHCRIYEKLMYDFSAIFNEENINVKNLGFDQKNFFM